MSKKAKKQPTKIVGFVLDQTESMAKHRQVTISGFNEYLAGLQNMEGDVLFSLTVFNTLKTELRHVAAPVQSVKPLTHETYVPDGTTNLYDAIGAAINKTQTQVESMKGKPDILFVIQTDGEENSSREYTRENIFDLITQKRADGWTFLFMGAGQDTWKQGSLLGVDAGNVLAYKGVDSVKSFAQSAQATARSFRTGQKRGLYADEGDLKQ